MLSSKVLSTHAWLRQWPPREKFSYSPISASAIVWLNKFTTYLCTMNKHGMDNRYSIPCKVINFSLIHKVQPDLLF